MTTLWCCTRADDPRALIRFLVDAFGFTELVTYGDEQTVHHAELAGPYGGGLMLGSTRPDNPSQVSDRLSVYLVVPDTDAFFARAVAAGAEVVMQPYDSDHGSRDCTLRDPAGNTWSIGTYAGHEG